MLPWAMRRRSASGLMSTSSTWSAAPHHRVGHRLALRHAGDALDTSFSDSRCWMLTVEITSMPAASSSSTSCQRLALRDPGTLVWASSSTSDHGRAAGQHGVDVHLLERGAAVARPPGAGRPRGPGAGPRSSAGRGSRRSRRRRRCRARGGASPRRAWRRSCRRPARRRGRCASRPRAMTSVCPKAPGRVTRLRARRGRG